MISPTKEAWLRSRDCFKILPFVVMQRVARVCQWQLSYLFVQNNNVIIRFWQSVCLRYYYNHHRPHHRHHHCGECRHCVDSQLLKLVVVSFCSSSSFTPHTTSTHISFTFNYHVNILCPAFNVDGAVAQRVERWTCDQQVTGSNPTRGKSCITTLCKLFTPMCLCHQAI